MNTKILRLLFTLAVCCSLMNACSSGRVDQSNCAVVPATFCDPFATIKNEASPTDISEIQRGSTADINKYHLTLGLFIRNRFELWGDSEVATFFRKNGVSHPDMMSHIMILGFAKYLEGEPVDMVALTKETVVKLTPPPPPPPPTPSSQN